MLAGQGFDKNHVVNLEQWIQFAFDRYAQARLLCILVPDSCKIRASLVGQTTQAAQRRSWNRNWRAGRAGFGNLQKRNTVFSEFNEAIQERRKS
jgi:hypothetical protein